MSEKNIRDQIALIRDNMGDGITYDSNIGSIGEKFFEDVNELQEMYGSFIGKAKINHQDYSEELQAMNNEISVFFMTLCKVSDIDSSFKLINLAVGKISELLSFVEALEASPPKKNVSHASFDKVSRERDELKKVVEVMVQYKGLPELNNLLESAKNVSLPLDEYWVLALCSSNLIEAVVNKKLEKLGEKTDGNFEERYKKLCRVIKEKEGRDISQLLPSAIYKVRNKLDHSSDSNKVTPKEAKEMSKMVIEFMSEVFP
jgi:hypothetical protein